MTRTRLLIVNEATRAKIKLAIERAERRPVPLAEVRRGSTDVLKAGEPDAHRPVMLADRNPGFRRAPSQHVHIQVGFRVAFSIEEQPAGFVRHLSVSVDEGEGGKLPNPEQVHAITKLFGITKWDSVWQEEFEPGRFAINIIQIWERQSGGHA
jgi:hypothetical protein